MEQYTEFPDVSSQDNFELFEKLKSEETNDMNFDQYTGKVYKDLSKIENEIISNLIKHDKNFLNMFKCFNETETILNSLESKLLGFKDKLKDINQDMKSLQSKSNNITVKYKNRKEFEEELFRLLDSIILAPDFLNDIINKEIDEEFVKKIKLLDEKLAIFQSGDVLPESNAIDEIVPEMRKTLAKVCSKIYSFILNALLMINKPNTNIQILQKHYVQKNAILIAFLKKHAVSMYKELVNKYTQLMEKIYSASTQKYCQELSKLVYDNHDKFSLISSDQLNKDLFLLVNERKKTILKEIEKESIVPVVAQKSKATYFYEQIFQSLNKFIMDLITWEVIFFNDFFEMGVHLSISYLNSIFKSSVSFIYDHIQKNIINKCNDFFAICLIIIVNHEQTKIMENMKINHLDLYFGKLNTVLWPKFDVIFNIYIDSIFKVNTKNTKLLINGIHTVTYKLGEFLSMINLLYKHTLKKEMLVMRVMRIQKKYNEFFYELSENYRFSNNAEREEIVTVFFINNLKYLLTQLNDFINSEDNFKEAESFKKTYNMKTENYINLLIKKKFEDLYRLHQACVVKQDLLESSRDNSKEINKSIFESYETYFNKNEIAKLSKNELKQISVSFNQKYREAFEQVKKDIFDSIKDKNNAIQLYIDFLREISNKYNNLIEILKITDNEDIIKMILSPERLAIEIDNMKKNI